MKSHERRWTETVEGIREQIVGLDEPMELLDGTKRPVLGFDNAATTPALREVMEEVNRQLCRYGSIGRGFGPKAEYTTELFNRTRRKVLEFVHAPAEEYSCFFVSNVTDGMNKLASALIGDPEEIVVASRLEHHSNDLPWRERCRVLYAETDDRGRLRMDELERLLRENPVRYVTVTAASNVTGHITDVRRAAELAHRYGAKLIVDGAQIAAHRAFFMTGETEEENVDFFVFSAHKMYAPYGSGAVVGLTSELCLHMPKVYGGGTIDIVSDYEQFYTRPPASYEAGSANFPGVAAMGKAIDLLTEIGFDWIEEHEVELNRLLMDGLMQLGMEVYGDTEHPENRVGVISFNDPGTNSFLLAQKLGEIGGIAVRRGAFCAHPYVWRLMGIPDEEVRDYKKCADARTPGMIRVSFGIYNTREEVEEFLRLLPTAIGEVRKDQQTGGTDAPAEF